MIWWLNNERNYVLELWKRYRREDRPKDTFYAEWLQPLFFMAFNHNYGFQTLNLPQDVKDGLANLPWLNGGLFAQTDVDSLRLTVGDDHFVDIFSNLLERYNFTTREDTPLDVEVAVDPEMLGKVYESLVIQEERGQAGIFYTPRIELDFMCRRSLIEYLAPRTTMPKSDVIRLVINADLGEDLPDITAVQREDVLHALGEVSVVDPACGSGAFLVGMMEVLMGLFELLHAQKQQAFDRFHRKREIISRNLYGVDIKEWAIRVAELRLWLSLVIETEEAGLDVTRPLLPNLSFRLRVGDSLVEEVAGQQLALRVGDGRMGKKLHDMVRELSRKKAQYFRAEGDVSDAEIRHAEQTLLSKILEDRADVLSKEIARYRANDEGTRASRMMEGIATAAEDDAGQVPRQAEKINSKLRELEAERNAIRNTLLGRLAVQPFLWEIDFAEVFYPADDSPGGFDIVIGNPPYVRNEEIVPLDVSAESLTREVKQAYKEKLYRSVQLLWGSLPLDRACDYYVYFYFSGLSLLREGGVFCFINSNSWLDVEYGAPLQAFLLQRMQIVDIYDNHARRTFKAADINTIIALIRRPERRASIGDHVVRFVAFKEPFEDCLTAYNVTTIESATESMAEVPFRVTVRTQAQLEEEGVVTTTAQTGQRAVSSSYRGAKWGGRYLRAPDVFFDILEHAGDRLIRLGDIAEIDSGINTRANDFFYLKRVPREQWLSAPLRNPTVGGIPEDCQVVRSDVGVARTRKCVAPILPTYWVIESRFLRPVLVSPQESPSILVDSKSLENLVLSVYDDWDALRGTLVRAYIEYAMDSHATVDRRTGVRVEGLAVNQRPELSKRKQSMRDGRRGAWWYAVRDKRYSPYLLPLITGDAFRTFLLNPVTPSDHNLFTALPIAELNGNGITLYLNSALAMMARELYGRANLGQGALKVEGVDWAQLPCPNAEILESLSSQYGDPVTLFGRRIGPAWEEATQPDKLRLDEMLLELLGVSVSATSLAEQAAQLVTSRIARADTFKAAKTRENRVKAVENLRGIWAGIPEEITEGEDPPDES